MIESMIGVLPMFLCIVIFFMGLSLIVSWDIIWRYIQVSVNAIKLLGQYISIYTNSIYTLVYIPIAYIHKMLAMHTLLVFLENIHIHYLYTLGLYVYILMYRTRGVDCLSVEDHHII